MRRSPKRIITVLVLLLAFSITTIVTLNMFSQPPHGLGLVGGRLADCPDSPNCVSSQSERESQRLPSIPFFGTASEAIASLKRVVSEMPRSRLVAEDGDYLRYEFRSFLLRFVDDVELLVDESKSAIHFRSASRVGYSDFGVNRRRMEEIRTRFLEATRGSDD
jgi:uncharacterized protein (DUF1499 family)